MLTALVYFIATLVLLYLTFIYARAYQRTRTDLTLFFTLTLFSFLFSQVISLIFIGLFYVTKQQAMLYWSDILGRMCAFVGAAFVIQIPLCKAFPKSTRRIYVTWFVLVLGVAASLYGLTLRYIPVVSPEGFIQWNVPHTFLLITNISLFLIWAAVAVIHLYEFEKSNYENLSSFWFGLGFLLSSLSMIDADFITGATALYLVNALLILGVIFLAIGIITDKSLSADSPSQVLINVDK